MFTDIKLDIYKGFESKELAVKQIARSKLKKYACVLIQFKGLFYIVAIHTLDKQVVIGQEMAWFKESGLLKNIFFKSEKDLKQFEPPYKIPYRNDFNINSNLSNYLFKEDPDLKIFAFKTKKNKEIELEPNECKNYLFLLMCTFFSNYYSKEELDNIKKFIDKTSMIENLFKCEYISKINPFKQLILFENGEIGPFKVHKHPINKGISYEISYFPDKYKIIENEEEERVNKVIEEMERSGEEQRKILHEKMLLFIKPKEAQTDIQGFPSVEEVTNKILELKLDIYETFILKYKDEYYGFLGPKEPILLCYEGYCELYQNEVTLKKYHYPMIHKKGWHRILHLDGYYDGAFSNFESNDTLSLYKYVKSSKYIMNTPIKSGHKWIIRDILFIFKQHARYSKDELIELYNVRGFDYYKEFLEYGYIDSEEMLEFFIENNAIIEVDFYRRTIFYNDGTKTSFYDYFKDNFYKLSEKRRLAQLKKECPWSYMQEMRRIELEKVNFKPYFIPHEGFTSLDELREKLELKDVFLRGCVFFRYSGKFYAVYYGHYNSQMIFGKKEIYCLQSGYMNRYSFNSFKVPYKTKRKAKLKTNTKIIYELYNSVDDFQAYIFNKNNEFVVTGNPETTFPNHMVALAATFFSNEFDEKEAFLFLPEYYKSHEAMQGLFSYKRVTKINPFKQYVVFDDETKRRFRWHQTKERKFGRDIYTNLYDL